MGNCEDKRMLQQEEYGLLERRTIARSDVTEEESHCLTCVFIVIASRFEGYIWLVSSGHGDGNKKKKKQCNWWCAACGGQYD